MRLKFIGVFLCVAVIACAQWIRYNSIRSSDRQGNGTKFQMFGAGTPSVGQIATYDANGNLVPSTSTTVFGSQTANYFLAAPNGAPGVPTFRAIVAADVPTLNQATTANAGTATALAADPADCTNQFARGIAASGAAACASVAGGDFATQTANYIFAGPATGIAAAPSFRALVSADIPNNAADTSGKATTAGNADTATALASNPTDCGVGEFANAIAASGNLTCAVPPGTGTALGLLVTKTAAAVLTIAAGNVRFGSTVYTLAGGTATITAGTGTAYIYIANDGTLTVAHNVTVTCSGCTATAGTSFPTDSIPLYTWTATATVWDVAGATDYRAYLSAKKVAAGTGITVSEATGHATVAVDTSVVPTLGGATMVKSIGYAFDGGGSALTTQNSPPFEVPVACTIIAWHAAVDAGTITFKVWKKATGTAVPTISDVINTSGVGISSNTAIRSTTLTDFSTAAVAANDMIIVAITAVATATKASFQLECRQ